MTSDLDQETTRLYAKLQHVGWTKDDCKVIAPMTLEINELKHEQNAVILAHSYQTPDISYGVADFVGDSYGLSLKAQHSDADVIVFSSVHFMAETAKILSPDKEVRVPAVAGCSLASSITADDVRALRAKHPGRPVVCYINTTAAVKAECDVCVTSSNVVQIIDALPEDEIIFIPDRLMAENVQELTDKKIISWNGTCIVHEKFDAAHVEQIKLDYPGAEILAHPECSPSVIDGVDFMGSTSAMLDYVRDSDKGEFFVASECGLTDRLMAEFEHKTFVGSCSLCPYMKTIALRDILTALKDPKPHQIVDLDADVLQKAKRCVERMIEMTEK